MTIKLTLNNKIKVSNMIRRYLTKLEIDYLKTEMCFDVESIERRLLQLSADDARLILKLVHNWINISSNASQKYSNSESINNPIVNKINQFLPDEAEFDDREAYLTADAFRHSFLLFAIDGFLAMYEHQENECWYPKIIVSKVLTPNDISELPKKIKIYRGCGKHELKTKIYGQAWTTDLDVARQFAFKHYSSQKWFDPAERVVLEAHIARNNVYYAKNSGEFEVVVNPNCLINIKAIDFANY